MTINKYRVTVSSKDGRSFQQTVLALSITDAESQVERIMTVNPRYTSVTVERTPV